MLLTWVVASWLVLIWVLVRIHAVGLIPFFHCPDESHEHGCGFITAEFRAGAEALGLRLATSSTPIQPVIVGDERAALAASAALLDAGYFVPAIRPPTVPAGSSRLRFTFSAAHSDADLERLLAALSTLVRRGLLP